MFERLTWSRRARRVLALLAEERSLLGEARLAEMSRVVSRREELMQALALHPAENRPEAVALLERIRHEARRNQRLTLAFCKGVENARRRFARIEAATRDIGLYSASGTRLQTETPGRSDRRA